MFIKAMVLFGQGADLVYLTTDKPSPFPMYNDPLTLSFECTAGTGEEYVKKHFNLSPEMVSRGPKLKHFKD